MNSSRIPLGSKVLDGFGGFGNMPTSLDENANMLPDVSTKDMTVSNTKPPCPVSHNSEPLGTPRGTPLLYCLNIYIVTRKK